MDPGRGRRRIPHLPTRPRYAPAAADRAGRGGSIARYRSSFPSPFALLQGSFGLSLANLAQGRSGYPALRGRDHRPMLLSPREAILHTMFVRYYLELTRPFEEVEAALLTS